MKTDDVDSISRGRAPTRKIDMEDALVKYHDIRNERDAFHAVRFRPPQKRAFPCKY